VRPCGAPKALAAELPPEFVFTENERETDFLIGVVGCGCEGMNRGVEITRIGRFGVPLSYVRDMRVPGR
jgi:hypothetical protein